MRTTIFGVEKANWERKRGPVGEDSCVTKGQMRHNNSRAMCRWGCSSVAESQLCMQKVSVQTPSASPGRAGEHLPVSEGNNKQGRAGVTELKLQVICKSLLPAGLTSLQFIACTRSDSPAGNSPSHFYLSMSRSTLLLALV